MPEKEERSWRFSDFSRWEQEFERMFEEFVRRSRSAGWWPGRGSPSVDIDLYEEKDAVVVKAELPGVEKENIDVNVTGNLLTIKGEKGREEDVKDENYRRRERAYGPFTRTVELPEEVQADQCKAYFKNGVLEIRLPKTESAKKKQFKINVE